MTSITKKETRRKNNIINNNNNNNKKFNISSLILVGIWPGNSLNSIAMKTAHASNITATAVVRNNSETQTTQTIYNEDGSCIRYFENGTEEVHFMHNLTGPAYIYEDGEIYHASNHSEVLLD